MKASEGKVSALRSQLSWLHAGHKSRRASGHGIQSAHGDADRLGGRQRAPCQVDLAEAHSVEQMVAFAVETFGGLHLAVNNAGIGGPSETTVDYPLGDWQRIMDVNLDGVFSGLEYEIAAMLKSGGGAIVNMSSILGRSVGKMPAPMWRPNMRSLDLPRSRPWSMPRRRFALMRLGGVIDTPLLTKHLDAETIGHLAALHPIGRLGSPREVSALTCFLLSGDASFITGSYHLVDGGYTAR